LSAIEAQGSISQENYSISAFCAACYEAEENAIKADIQAVLKEDPDAMRQGVSCG
jgi:hypothetical protein